jgi:leucyl aminopeptidase
MKKNGKFDLQSTLKITAKKLDSKLEGTVVVLVPTTSKGDKHTPVTNGLPRALGQFIADLFSEKDTVPSTEGTAYKRSPVKGFDNVVVIRTAASEEMTAEDLRVAAAHIHRHLSALKVSAGQILLTTMPAKVQPQTVGSALAEGLTLSTYNFNAYKKSAEAPALKAVDILAAKALDGLSEGIKVGVTLAECVNFSRSLGDRPGNLMTPTILANETIRAAKGTQLKVTVWGKDKISKENMGCFLGVSLGSSQEPKFIIMQYNGAGKSKKPVCFVGKGLTFDSGGISIKPSAGMEEMKFDMCGGANVIGTMLAIARLKLNINAIGLVPATENMPGPNANKPGDICFARNGISVEVNNTDAEGRLILADALVYASEQEPQFIIDAATLTGAMSVALGNLHTGFFTRDEDLNATIQAAAEHTGELVWRMPMVADHLKDMKGTYADLSNISSGKGAGSATAAAFLSEFVDKKIPWAHFDIAGTAWHTGGRVPYNPKKGASGVMIRTFVEVAKQFE